MMKPAGNGKGGTQSARGSVPALPSRPHMRHESAGFSKMAVRSPIERFSRSSTLGMCKASVSK